MNDIEHQYSEYTWDAPGFFSIVLQGPIFSSNVNEIANACIHWRRLFPQAEIIISISNKNLSFNINPSEYSDDSNVNDSTKGLFDILGVKKIEEYSDKIVISKGALQLPPIKSDSDKLNHCNMQIQAAKDGLNAVTGKYVLRIRNDIIFLDRQFLNQYEENVDRERGDAAYFTKRILISWLFTLNPYTLERLPLHISDWFNLGPTEDVRKLWNVPEMTLADAVHYRAHHHMKHSNAREKQFNTRLAVEQHVAFNCFSPQFPDLILNYHNDLTNVERAMDILLDNFVLCDLIKANCVFEKYRIDFDSLEKKYHCLTPADWDQLVSSRQKDYKTILANKISGQHIFLVKKFRLRSAIYYIFRKLKRIW